MPGLYDSSGGLWIKTGDSSQERGFSTSGRSEKTDEFAVVNFKRKILYCDKLTKMFCEIFNA